MSEQRLDKWLWCARLVETRSGAARAIADGKVRINGQRALKASRLVHQGDVVTATSSGKLFVVRVVAWTVRRGPASLAHTLYEDLTPQAPSSARDVAKVTSHKGLRPTKRDRRRLDALCTESSKF
jgi:ribosome-associated heat shock protein Hsp15